MARFPNRLLAVVVLSASIGLVGGAATAWGIYQRVGPATEKVISVTSPGSSGRNGSAGATVGTIAQERAASVVEVVTQPQTVDGLLRGQAGLATGFVATSGGLVVTSAHAVAGATTLRITTSDGHGYDASIAGVDAVHGIVVLQASGATGLVPLPFAPSPPAVGDLAIAVGRPPLGSLSVVSGTVSTTGRTVTTGTGSDTSSVAGAVTVDALVPDTHDDGAPVLDSTGAVIGVALVAPGSPSGLVALSGAAASGLVTQLSGGGGAQRPSFGLLSQLLVPATAAAIGLPPGALVVFVTPGGAAAAAGIVPNDVITSVNGTAVDEAHPLDPTLYSPGQQVQMAVVHDGVSRTVTVAVAAS